MPAVVTRAPKCSGLWVIPEHFSTPAAAAVAPGETCETVTNVYERGALSVRREGGGGQPGTVPGGINKHVSTGFDNRINYT